LVVLIPGPRLDSAGPVGRTGSGSQVSRPWDQTRLNVTRRANGSRLPTEAPLLSLGFSGIGLNLAALLITWLVQPHSVPTSQPHGQPCDTVKHEANTPTSPPQRHPTTPADPGKSYFRRSDSQSARFALAPAQPTPQRRINRFNQERHPEMLRPAVMRLYRSPHTAPRSPHHSTGGVPLPTYRLSSPKRGSCEQSVDNRSCCAHVAGSLDSDQRRCAVTALSGHSGMMPVRALLRGSSRAFQVQQGL
jgi:hypothetical protein